MYSPELTPECLQEIHRISTKFEWIVHPNLSLCYLLDNPKPNIVGTFASDNISTLKQTHLYEWRYKRSKRIYRTADAYSIQSSKQGTRPTPFKWKKDVFEKPTILIVTSSRFSKGTKLQEMDLECLHDHRFTWTKNYLKKHFGNDFLYRLLRRFVKCGASNLAINEAKGTVGPDRQHEYYPLCTFKETLRNIPENINLKAFVLGVYDVLDYGIKGYEIHRTFCELKLEFPILFAKMYIFVQQAYGCGSYLIRFDEILEALDNNYPISFLNPKELRYHNRLNDVLWNMFQENESKRIKSTTGRHRIPTTSVHVEKFELIESAVDTHPPEIEFLESSFAVDTILTPEIEFLESSFADKWQYIDESSLQDDQIQATKPTTNFSKKRKNNLEEFPGKPENLIAQALDRIPSDSHSQASHQSLTNGSMPFVQSRSLGLSNSISSLPMNPVWSHPPLPLGRIPSDSHSHG
jgi:hypothetical protein